MDLYFREKYLAKLREFYHETEIIKVITGVRRCGKSSFMQMIMKELLDLGIEKENIIYFNLDKRPYFEITTAKQLDKLIEKCGFPKRNAMIPPADYGRLAQEVVRDSINYCAPKTMKKNEIRIVLDEING